MNNEEKIAAVEDALDCGHPELIAQTTRAGQGGRLAGKSNRPMDCAPEVTTGQGAAITPEQYAQLERPYNCTRLDWDWHTFRHSPTARCFGRMVLI